MTLTAIPHAGGLTDIIDLRELTPVDVHVLDDVFAGMSDESRYLRYLTSMPALPSQARRILNGVDGCRHVAVGAFVGDKAIGLARAISLGDGRAELALEVVDVWHGRGVGSLLARWIRDRTSELGYTALVAETSAGNAAAQALTRRIFPDYTVRRLGTVLEFTLPVASAHGSAA